MRILRLIISAFLFFTVIIVGGFFLIREVLLYWGGNSIRNSLKELSLARTRGSFASQCSELGSRVTVKDSLVNYQLRFISSSEYLIEAVCAGFNFDPILIAQKTLPQFVTKVPGTSGFVLSPLQSGIEIEIFEKEITKLSKETGFDFSFLRKRKSLTAENGILVKLDANMVASEGPVTVCSGYGYSCCDEVSHFGVGDRIIGLPDCESSCYASCASRPVILSFNTSPLMSRETRIVTISAGNAVEFTYVADSGSSKSISGILDFGDGEKSQISGLANQTSHTYECNSSRCEYLAKIILEDSWGVQSADLQTNRVKIIVTR